MKSTFYITLIACFFITQASFAQKKPKNIIFLIGDGMGTTQIYSGLTANKGKTAFKDCKHISFSRTNSADNYITDSAAGATAFSTGVKTYNGAIGVDVNKKPLKTILEMAEERGMATGLVATCSITHATPASFIAHQPSRKMDEAIAADFLKTDIDLFIGGGKKFFEKRTDKKKLLKQLKKKGYQLPTNMTELQSIKSGKVAALLYENHPPKMSEGRGDYLGKSAMKAIELLDKNDKGFFLMVEGSQIDWGGHANDADYIMKEMVDFDSVVERVLAFAKKDGETLVVITADHETGGFAINGGDLATGKVEGAFTTGHHTAVMVPVFAYGPGADTFFGIYHNNTIFSKMCKAIGL